MEIYESLLFPHSYEYEVLEEIPSVVSNIYFIPPYLDPEKSGPANGLMLKIHSKNNLPYLCTVRGSMEAVRQSKIYSTPDLDKICVVVGGQGYIFSTIKPNLYEAVKCIWIQDVAEVLSHGLIIFTDYCYVVAYDSEGLRWQTKRFEADGIKIKEVTSTHVIVEYNNMGARKITIIELETGKDISM